MVGKALFSSDSTEWGTPVEFFDKLNQEFHFTLDVCGTHENAKVKIFYDRIANGLNQPWDGVCWCNPPYGSDIGKWVKKSYSASTRGATVVCLLPARTDTRWFHDWVLGKAELRFIKGRLTFEGAKNPAPFPSMLAIFRPVVSGY